MADKHPIPNSPLDICPSGKCWVVKLGGSLLDQPDLTKRLRTVLGRVSTKPLLVIGGGAAADAVRQWDQIHRLSASAAHWLAIRTMDFHRHLMETLLPEAMGVSHPNEAHHVWEQHNIAILKTWDWLQAEEAEAESLPHSWEVTSDSIAAWAAIRWRAAGLLLLKSVDLPDPPLSLSESLPAFVDRYFPQLAPRLPQIAWCNLNSPVCEIVNCKALFQKKRRVR